MCKPKCWGTGNCPEDRNASSCGWVESCLRECIKNLEQGLYKLGMRNELFIETIKYLGIDRSGCDCTTCPLNHCHCPIKEMDYEDIQERKGLVDITPQKIRERDRLNRGR